MKDFVFVQAKEWQQSATAEVVTIAVTAVINLVEGGRRKFVYDCGVIGICPPCTRATPLVGVWPY